MIRLIFARHQLYSPGSAEDVTYETAFVHCPEIEQRIDRGGHEFHGLHDFTRLVGAELVSGTKWELFEYQVRWKREGKKQRAELFSTKAAAERCVDRIRGNSAYDEKEVPALEYVHLLERPVGEFRMVLMAGAEM